MSHSLCAIKNLDPSEDNSLTTLMGNGVTVPEIHKFLNRFGNDIWVNELYGASELPTVIYAPRGQAVPGAVGRLSPHNQEVLGIKIVKCDTITEEPIRDPETGFLIPCEPNEPGMVVMRTSEIFQFSGYYGDSKKSDAKKIHNCFEEDDLWINSGDMLVMNDEYEVFFCERLGDTFRTRVQIVTFKHMNHMI